MSSLIATLVVISCACAGDEKREEDLPPADELILGADLSYVNQILDKGGVYNNSAGELADPYEIFAAEGTDLVRLRLWHNPTWTREVYGDEGSKMYNDIHDVTQAIEKAHDNDMQVLLDFHYADTWVDPGKQSIPAAWQGIRSMDVLEDSVYNYTFRTLKHLKDRNLLPAMVQIGNETNCGMLYTDAPPGFPAANACNGAWQNLGRIINSAISAITDISPQIKIVLHVADPKNVEWWFANITSQGGVHDFHVIGFSYYPLWHTTVNVNDLGSNITAFRSKFGKDVMILETAYPWTTYGKDNYNNLFGSQTPVDGYPFTAEGQRDMMIAIAREVRKGGGLGVIYWEPAWISTPDLKDLWGMGSSWENATFFDFYGKPLPAMDFFDESTH